MKHNDTCVQPKFVTWKQNEAHFWNLETSSVTNTDKKKKINHTLPNLKECKQAEAEITVRHWTFTERFLHLSGQNWLWSVKVFVH